MNYLTVNDVEARVGNLNTMGWGHVWSEVKELKDAIIDCSLIASLDELCDTITTATVALKKTCGISLPIIWKSSVIKWASRMDLWKALFKEYDLEFDGKYLLNGGNMDKIYKQGKALIVAAVEQGREEVIPEIIEVYEYFLEKGDEIMLCNGDKFNWYGIK